MICKHFLELLIKSHVLITPFIYNCPFFFLYNNNFSEFLTQHSLLGFVHALHSDNSFA